MKASVQSWEFGAFVIKRKFCVKFNIKIKLCSKTNNCKAISSKDVKRKNDKSIPIMYTITIL